MEEYQLYDYVEIENTQERGFIVWLDNKQDSYMIEIKGKYELPKFYQRKDFKRIGKD